MIRYKWMAVGLITLSLTSYIVLFPYDFKVSFASKTVPGDIIQTLRIWDAALPNAEIQTVDENGDVCQIIVWDNAGYEVTWHFQIVNDSTSNVSVFFTEPGRRLVNKIMVPLSNQKIERDAEAITREFYNVLKEHLEITRVKLDGLAVLDSMECICASARTSQREKATFMMASYPHLTSFLDESNVKVIGPPMIRVSFWDFLNDSLNYDFCFRVANAPAADKLPQNLTRKKFEPIKAIKAVYNGNYITSDRAWFVLKQSAKTRKLSVVDLPIEFFFDNPNLGLNEKKWRAEAYLPLK